jgi:hypothetical protein
MFSFARDLIARCFTVMVSERIQNRIQKLADLWKIEIRSVVLNISWSCRHMPNPIYEKENNPFSAISVPSGVAQSNRGNATNGASQAVDGLRLLLAMAFYFS